MSRQKNVPAAGDAARLPKTYVEWRDPFPPEPPTVKLIFHGLFCCFFDGMKECFVGTHNTTHRAGGPHTGTHPHDYEVRILQKDNGAPTVLHPSPAGDPRGFPPLDITVTGSAFPGGVAPGVYVYTGPLHDQFGRRPADDPRDWRWVIDFEEEMYPGGVKGRIPDSLLPGVTIDNGLFHTHKKTAAQFDLVPENGSAIIPMNSVAEEAAANIYLGEGGFVQLTGGPVGDLRLDYAPNRTYEVYILNLCDGNAHATCKYDPNSRDKKKRNDFFLYYETFDPSQNGPEYLLVKRGRVRASDDSPCGPTSYGGTSKP